jgi:tRNA(Ile)-lysidine synthase
MLPTFVERIAEKSPQFTGSRFFVLNENRRLSDWQLLYHFPVHELAERLLETIRKQESMRAGDRVAAAVSGGADSVALLCLLLELRGELGIVLSVAHVNHKLRGEESDGDERFVAALARQHGLELHTCDAPMDAGHDSGIEAEARKKRYDFFRELTRNGRVVEIATAHTLDDQAETVLMRLFRGTGIRGLAGIHPRISLKANQLEVDTLESDRLESDRLESDKHGHGEVVRPLLGFHRVTLQNFLRERGQTWREDSSNADTSFLRNRIRHRLLPVIEEEFGEAAIEHMAELAEIARAEEEHWERGHPEIRAEISRAQISRGHISETPPAVSLPVGPLLALPLAAQRRLVRAWLETNALNLGISFHIIEQALDLAGGPAGGKIELPCGYHLRRTRDDLCLDSSASEKRDGYEYSLLIPGEVEIPELGIRLRAMIVDPKDVPEAERDSLIEPQCLPGAVLVRNWQPGDRYWPAHTKQGKKVKDLLSDRHATGATKKMWPVLVGRGDLVWMRGFPVPEAIRVPAGSEKAVWIRELRP